MNSIFMLIYSSKSTESGDISASLKSILESSRRNNLRDNITGFLVAHTGHYFQLLEGPKEKVLACLERITQDSRNTNVVIQGQAETEKRITPDWSMGLVDSGAMGAQDILDLFDLGRPKGRGYSESKSLEAMLRIFIKDAQLI